MQYKKSLILRHLHSAPLLQYQNVRVGYLESCLGLTKLLTALPMGDLSDKYGRTPAARTGTFAYVGERWLSCTCCPVHAALQGTTIFSLTVAYSPITFRYTFASAMTVGKIQTCSTQPCTFAPPRLHRAHQHTRAPHTYSRNTHSLANPMLHVSAPLSFSA